MFSKRNQVLQLRNQQKLFTKQPVPFSDGEITKDVYDLKEEFKEVYMHGTFQTLIIFKGFQASGRQIFVSKLPVVSQQAGTSPDYDYCPYLDILEAYSYTSTVSSIGAPTMLQASFL